MRKLMAIVEWTDAGVAVRQMEGFEERTEAGVVVRSMEEFDLPGRTTVKMSFPLPLSPKPVGTAEETFILISAYRCIDCGFETESPDLMKEHQRSGKHTLWQRIRRLVGHSEPGLSSVAPPM